jgi:hypothetical protein
MGQFGPIRRGSVSKSTDFEEPKITIFQNAFTKTGSLRKHGKPGMQNSEHQNLR